MPLITDAQAVITAAIVLIVFIAWLASLMQYGPWHIAASPLPLPKIPGWRGELPLTRAQAKPMNMSIDSTTLPDSGSDTAEQHPRPASVPATVAAVPVFVPRHRLDWSQSAAGLLQRPWPPCG